MIKNHSRAIYKGMIFLAQAILLMAR